MIVAWAAVFVASAWAASGLSDLLTNRFTLPGTDTERAEEILEQRFGQRTSGSFTIVARVPGRAGEVVEQVEEAAGRASARLPTSRVVAVRAVSEDVVTAQLVSDLEPAGAKGYTEDMREALASSAIDGATLYVTG